MTVLTPEAPLRAAAPFVGRRLSAAAFALSALVVLLPFEPRATWPLLGLRVTVLEAAAGLAMIALLLAVRRHLPALLRHPPLPLAALWLYASVHVVSALATPFHRGLAVKFALRMVVLAAFATLVAALPAAARRQALRALPLAALAVALLAVAEGLGFRGLEPFLDAFRETPFNVAGVRRATAGSEYPNLAAAFLMYGLLAGVGLAVASGTGRARTLVLAAVLASGLAFTYSRGALVATLLGLVAVTLHTAWRTTGRAHLPAACVAVVVAVSALFVLRGDVFRLRLAGEGTERWYGAAYAPAERTLRAEPGERRLTTVHVTNTGRKAWSRGEAFHLSYHLMTPGGPTTIDGPRTLLPDVVRPGETAVTAAEIRAPLLPGRYLLIWDLVHEHTTWFSGQGVAPAVVPLVVGDGFDALPASSQVPADLTGPLVWTPGRGELWRLAVDLWRERPLLGAGSDNYRHLYGARAGRTFWDRRVYANNTLLEAAATTGTFGALALAVVLVSTLWRAAWTPSPEGAALFALAVGVAAHGVVDYVLAATGHYLLFGLLVGAVAGAEART